MAIHRHHRSYVTYQPGYNPDAPGVAAWEFTKFARARARVLQWGDGSQIVEWIETQDKEHDYDAWTNREWIVRGGRLRKVLHKTETGELVFSEIK